MTIGCRSISLALVLLLAAPVWGQEVPTRTGVAVDARGTPAFDPSENVKALNEAANKRQDDLRIALRELINAKLEAVEKISEIRYAHSVEVATALATTLRDEIKLRSEYDEKLRALEKTRLDAIRTVDQGSAAIANERAVAQAAILSKTVSDTAGVQQEQVRRTADDLRTLVATTAATALQAQQQQFNTITTLIEGISKRVTTLESIGSEVKGRSGPQDPAIAALIQEMQKLSQSQTSRAGTDQGRSDVIGWIVAGILLLIGLGGLFLRTSARVRR